VVTSRQAQHKKRQREKGYKAFEVELSPEDQAQLSSLSTAMNVSQSEAIRRAISAAFTNQGG